MGRESTKECVQSLMEATQLIQDLALSPEMGAVRQHIDLQRIVDDAIAIQQIPAPTFAEEKRAAYLRQRFEQYPTLCDIAVDEVHNVYGRWPGEHSDSPALLVSAHTDTVFDIDADLTIRRDDSKIYGPGLGDNSLGVAGLLALLDLFEEHRLRPAGDIWFVANSREEGLGNLDGMRAAWQTLGARLGAAVVLEGMAFGRIYHAGIAVRRLHITCRAPGGHSWLHFGQPSAIHGLIELGGRILSLTPPTQPRTTYNIGLIDGGHSVNSIATSAGLYLDLRSEKSGSLAVLEQQVMDFVKDVQRTDLSFSVDVVGDRPAGIIAQDHPLVQLAAAALRAVNITPAFEMGSTDANILLANGLPTVTVGLSHGGHAHRLDEYIETGPITDGLWHLLLLVMAAAGQVHAWSGHQER